MTVSFYPPHLRTLFTDRERELAVLEQATRSLAEGRPRHLALFGLRRIGKTLLLMEHLTRLAGRPSPSPRCPSLVHQSQRLHAGGARLCRRTQYLHFHPRRSGKVRKGAQGGQMTDTHPFRLCKNLPERITSCLCSILSVSKPEPFVS